MGYTAHITVSHNGWYINRAQGNTARTMRTNSRQFSGGEPRKRLYGVFLALALVNCLTHVSNAQCVRYHVTASATPCPPFSTTPYAINGSADLVGGSSCGEYGRAFVAWEGGSSALIPLPGSDGSTAHDINDRCAIVGVLEGIGFGHRGFLYHQGDVTILDCQRGHNWSEAHAINDAMICAGLSANVQTGPQLACRWIDGNIEILPLPVGPESEANDINHSGQIVGWMGVAPVAQFPAEAFLWDNGITTPLGKPHGATNSTANAISSSGIICGYFTQADPQGPGGYARKALAWIDGKMIPLGVLPGYVQSLAFDVNDSGEIVGYCSKPPSGASIAFIWRDGHMKALGDLLAPGYSNHQVWYAYGINSQGQITAAVKLPQMSERAALLTPIPPRSGDTNCDWLVNVNDLLNIINAWGPAAAKTPFQGSPDLNDDGTVNVNDLLAVINDWG